MGSLIFKLSLIALLVGFLVFLAYDDYRSRKEREAEDREKEAALPDPERHADQQEPGDPDDRENDRETHKDR